MIGSLQAQLGRGKITGAEFYYDSDPGSGLATPLALQGNINDAVRNAIGSTSANLSAGVHTINIRMQDSLGHWGPVFKTTLSVENLLTSRNVSAALARFYWDTDVANAVNLIFLNGNVANAVNSFVNSSALNTFSSAGAHTLSVQVMDATGQFSPPFTTAITVENAITSRVTSAAIARAYWDNNVAGATNMIILNGNAGSAINTFVNATPVSTFSSNSIHKLNVQLLDPNGNGNYSPAFTTVVKFDDSLKVDRSIKVWEARVWIDNATPPSANMIAFDGNFNDALESAMHSFPVPAVGVHTINVQVKDSANWSPTFTTTVSIESPIAYRNINLSAAQLFWDSDTAGAISMVAFDGIYDNAIETAINNSPISVATLSAGVHKLNVRVMDVAGNWGKIFNTTLSVENPTTMRDIRVVQGEVSVDSNPAAMVIALNGNFANAIESAQATLISSGLSIGLHTLNTRMKGLDNNWGPNFTTAILVSPCASTPTPVVTTTRPTTFCNGDSTILTANAGYASYQWINNNTVVSTASTFIAKTSGSYTVIVTDGTGCPGAATPVVVDMHNPIVNITNNATFCQGTVDSLKATTGFTSYIWSAGSTTSKQFVSTGGTYTVTVADNIGCTKTASTTIGQLAQPPVPVITGNGPLSFCPGFNVTLSSSAATNILWSNGSTSQSFTVDTAGSYVVTVTGANGCKTSSAAVTTIKYPAASAFINPTSSPVCAYDTSAIYANASASYLWSNGATTQVITAPAAGSYTVAIVDLHGCTASVTTPFVVNPLPAIPTISLSGPTSFCNGGSITLTSSSATNNLWSNGVTTQSQTAFVSATYVDTVHTNIGCKAHSAPVVIDVHPVASVTASGPTTFCAGDSVTLTAYPASGVSYQWSNGASTQSVKLFSSINISVIVTELVGGCSDTVTTNVIVNPLPIGSIAPTTPISVCYGNTVNFSTSGSPNCIYKWFVNGSPIVYYSYNINCNCLAPYNVYGYTYNASLSGSYSAQIIDTLTGCTNMTNSIVATIVTPPKPIISANGGTTLCIGANTILSSTVAVSYLWSTGETTQSIVAAVSGNYVVTITDGLGCTRASDVTPVSFFPVASISSSGSTTLCQGENVSLTANPTGSYLWSNGSTNAVIPNINTPGSYVVTVTDLNGCTSESPQVDVIVNQLPTGSISASGPTTVCQGNSILLTTTGSAHTIFKWYANGSPITYLGWNGNSYQIYYTYGYTFSANTAGSYSAQVIDTLTGCTSMTNSIVVSINPLPTATITQTAFVSCFGGSNGALIANGAGTTGSYSYLWNNGNTNQTATGLNAANYTVVVTDLNTCTTTAAYSIGQPTAVAPSLVSPVNTRGYNVSCYGSSDGSIYINAGGTPPYSYVWSTGSTNASISGIPAGTYSATVTDANGCTGSGSVTLTQPVSISLTLQPSVFIGGNNIRCKNGSDGYISANASGGTGPFTYSWSNAATTQTAAGLTAGAYTVTVTDSVGCSSSATITLTEPTLLVHSLTPSIYSGYNVSCNGSADGSITVVVSGSTPGYAYSWADTVFTKNRNGLIAGTYFLTVSDTNGCNFTDSIAITQPTAIVAVSTGSVLNCYGDNTGTTTVAASGGDGPYTYQWTGGSTNATATGLIAGVYQVTITDSRGCSKVTSAQVTQPQELIGYAFGTYIYCGSQIGLLSITAAGGTSPYTFLWSNGSTASFQTNLPVGNYSVTVTDAHGCWDTAYAVILNPPTFVVTVSSMNVPCQNSTTGFLKVDASGGVPPYMYLWSNGATVDSIYNLGIGTYSVTVTDANGCVINRFPQIIPDHVITNLYSKVSVCGNGTYGSIALINSSGGTLPYSYLWSNGSTNTSISGLSAGTYYLTTSDGIGCATTDTIVIQSFPIPVPLITGSLIIPPAGNTILDAGAGYSSYLWSTGATTQTIAVTIAGTYSVTVTNVGGCTASTSATATQTSSPEPVITGNLSFCVGQSTLLSTSVVFAGYSWSNGATTQSITVNSAGIYTVTVSDNNSNTGSSSATVVVLPAPSPSITGSLSFCAGDSSVLNAGTGFSTYLWSTGSTTQSVVVKTQGLYVVTVTNEQGCSASANTTVVVNANPTTVITGNTLLCPTASSTLNAGIGYASYLWSTGSTTQTQVVNTPGNYSVIVTNGFGCSGSASVTVNQSLPLAVTNAVTNVLCKGNNTGSIVLNVSNGQGGYSFLWSDGVTTKDRYNLYAGPLTVTVTDNCTSIITSFKITEPATGMLFTVPKTSPKCNGGNNGSASITVSGGIAPYTYLWSNGKTTVTILSLTAGIYTCTVFDASGCTRSVIAIITEPSALLATATKVNPTGGFNNGSATALPSGGTPPYTYIWNTVPSKTTATITGLGAGVYNCKVIDKNGCYVNTTVTLIASRFLSALYDQDLNLDISPNPNDGNFVLSINACCEAKATVQLFDNTARLIERQSLMIIQGENQKEMNFNKLAKGLYYLKYDDGAKIKTIKVVIN